MNKGPTVLVILDGWGVAPAAEDNAIHHAHTPCMDRLKQQYHSTTLHASGSAVGLPDGYIGNSEVGHMTIGAGRIMQQPVSRLFQMMRDGSLVSSAVMRDLCASVQKQGGTLHLMGLLSDGGVHSHEEHMHALIDIAAQHGVTRLVVHPFLDGRDVPLKSAQVYLSRLEDVLKKTGIGVIGSLHGRFYAMDRDNNWDRTEKTFRVLTEPQANQESDWRAVLEKSYAQGVTDEFVEPVQLRSDATIGAGDGILFANVRPDRARQLTATFAATDTAPFSFNAQSLARFVTAVAYNDFSNVSVLLESPVVHNTLKDQLIASGKRFFCVSETEKYAHVTYFFTGGREKQVPGETRVQVSSIVAQDYAGQPRMSADEITEIVMMSLETDPHDFYLINYANADMVGHSGDFDATVQAVSCLDEQIERLYTQVVKSMHGVMYITADHGKAEDMFDEQWQQPRVAHTTNKVPFIVVGEGVEKVDGVVGLADIAPCILRNMGLDVPDDMTGSSKK